MIRIQNVFCSFWSIGNVCKQVYFALYKFFIKIIEISVNIFIFPTGIGRNSLKVFISIAERLS